MNRQDFRFFHRLRVRWVEVDMQKIVFNAHYLMYFDTAISDYWRALALPYEESMQALGGDLYVRKASVEYLGSARFDDRLDVALRCARIGNSSLTFEGAIFRGDDLLVSCTLVYVFADPGVQASRPVPEALRRLLTDYEAGSAMVVLQAGDWHTLGAEAAALRHAVFVQEQGISAALEPDGADADAVHMVARNGLGQCIGTARLIRHADGSASIGRMAVKRVLRGTQVGQRLLAALLDIARQRGEVQVTLKAQRSAQDFYQRQGFMPQGEPFEEAGIAHITMVRAL